MHVECLFDITIILRNIIVNVIKNNQYFDMCKMLR